MTSADVPRVKAATKRPARPAAAVEALRHYVGARPPHELAAQLGAAKGRCDGSCPSSRTRSRTCPSRSPVTPKARAPGCTSQAARCSTRCRWPHRSCSRSTTFTVSRRGRRPVVRARRAGAAERSRRGRAAGCARRDGTRARARGLPGPAGRRAFSHALIRDALYDGMTATRRALWHRRVGASHPRRAVEIVDVRVRRASRGDAAICSSRRGRRYVRPAIGIPPRSACARTRPAPIVSGPGA